MGIETARRLAGLAPVDFPAETAIGALALYVSNPAVTAFQPMNINFGLIPPLDRRIRGKREKNEAIAKRALDLIERIVSNEAEQLTET